MQEIEMTRGELEARFDKLETLLRAHNDAVAARLDAMVLLTRDHEQRLRAAEKARWMATGVATFIASICAILASFVRVKFGGI